jgi:hypothetical protein
MSDALLFAYGSLVDPGSAAMTLGRPVELAALGRIDGWTRRWTVARDNLSSEKGFARADDGSVPRWCLGLSLEPAPDQARERAPNGALIVVTDAELDRLDLRELRHERVEVTDAVRVERPLGAVPRGLPPNDDDPIEPSPDRRTPVVAYRARPVHRRLDPPEDAVIIASYVATLEAAFAALGPGELEHFRATTEPPPVEVIEAVLVRDRIPVGNPREW